VIDLAETPGVQEGALMYSLSLSLDHLGPDLKDGSGPDRLDRFVDGLLSPVSTDHEEDISFNSGI
jgi:hypothetical protein